MATIILEQGNIYFFYRPVVEEEEPTGLEDIQRFHMILQSKDKPFRYITVGKKKLPETDKAREQVWGFVETVSETPDSIQDQLRAEEYATKTRGTRHQPAARPAGEGVYAIAMHEDHTHLLYALELPQEPGDVQEELNIKPEASYIISVKNPEASSPPGVGLPRESRAELPKDLQGLFNGRRFYMLEPPEFLAYRGVELLLIGATEDAKEELGISCTPEKETQRSADIFTDLKLQKHKYPAEPLFSGAWE